MPRYFFNVVDGKFLVDSQGTVLEGMPEAREMAITTAGEILRDHGVGGWNGGDWQMHVTNEAKETVLKLSFSATEPVPPE